MKDKRWSILPVLMTLASAISVQVLTSALAMLRTFLRDTPWERIVPLARQFRDVLERFLLDRVEKFLAEQPDTDERKQLLDDWKRLDCPVAPGPCTDAKAEELLTEISALNRVEDYLERRDDLLAELAALPEAARNQAALTLRSKVAELLFYATVPEMQKFNFDPVTTHQFRVWTELTNCIDAGAEAYAIYFLCFDGMKLRILSPWTLTADATVEELYLTARIIARLHQMDIPWDHDRLVTCLYHLLDLKVRCLMDHGDEDADTQELLALYAMFGWTERDEFRSYWELPRFRENLSKYYKEA